MAKSWHCLSAYLLFLVLLILVKQVFMTQASGQDQVLRMRARRNLWARGQEGAGHVGVMRFQDVAGGGRRRKDPLMVALQVMLEAFPPSERLATNLTSKRLHLEKRQSKFACGTSLPLASTRWVQSTFSSNCPLSSKQRR